MKYATSSLEPLVSEETESIAHLVSEYGLAISRFKCFIQSCNISDIKQISNLSKIEVNIQTRYTLVEPEASKLFAENAKNIFILFLNISNLQGRKVLIKDLYLIHDEGL